MTVSTISYACDASGNGADPDRFDAILDLVDAIPRSPDAILRFPVLRVSVGTKLTLELDYRAMLLKTTKEENKTFVKTYLNYLIFTKTL